MHIENLRDSYSNKTDRELIALAAERDCLTEGARRALDTEMTRRGLRPKDIENFREELAREERRRKRFRRVSFLRKRDQLFWFVLLSPGGPLLIAALAFRTSLYLLTHQFGVASPSAKETSAYIFVCVALIIWLGVMIIGVGKIRGPKKRGK